MDFKILDKEQNETYLFLKETLEIIIRNDEQFFTELFSAEITPLNNALTFLKWDFVLEVFQHTLPKLRKIEQIHTKEELVLFNCNVKFKYIDGVFNLHAITDHTDYCDENVTGLTHGSFDYKVTDYEDIKEHFLKEDFFDCTKWKTININNGDFLNFGLYFKLYNPKSKEERNQFLEKARDLELFYNGDI